MGVQFYIDGQDPQVWCCDFTNRNARIVAKVIGLDLEPEGFGIYGELQPADCVAYVAAIEKAMIADLSEYAITGSDTRQPVGAGSTRDNVTELRYGLRVINQGIDADGIRDRLGALLLLFQRAVEVNSSVTWS